MIYRDGNGVPQDYEQAVTWHRKAAEQGFANAQYTMGVMYLYGIGISQNKDEAREWLQKATAQGHVSAQEVLKRLDLD